MDKGTIKTLMMFSLAMKKANEAKDAEKSAKSRGSSTFVNPFPPEEQIPYLHGKPMRESEK